MDRTQLRKFRKSLVVGPAETALRSAENVAELDEAWEDYCDGFADETPERDHLLAIYMGRVKDFKDAEAAARMLRV